MWPRWGSQNEEFADWSKNFRLGIFQPCLVRLFARLKLPRFPLIVNPFLAQVACFLFHWRYHFFCLSQQKTWACSVLRLVCMTHAFTFLFFFFFFSASAQGYLNVWKGGCLSVCKSRLSKIFKRHSTSSKIRNSKSDGSSFFWQLCKSQKFLVESSMDNWCFLREFFGNYVGWGNG